MRKWMFFRIQTPEIVVPSENREVAIGVIGTMIRFGPFMIRSKKFTGSVYKLVNKFSYDEYTTLPQLEQQRLTKMPYNWDECFNYFCTYEKVMSWSPKFENS